MKKLRVLLCILLAVALLAGFSGCYVIRGQTIRKLKGTYKLTHYTYTPQYRNDGSYRPDQRDYINDEKYLYEDYLVITGEGIGYYVHKAAGVPAYAKEVSLSYEYSQEDSSKIEYVIFQDALTTSAEPGVNKVGVNGNSLNYSKSSVDLFGIQTEAISVHWEKVDSAADLSYAREQLGALKEYDYCSFGIRGIYLRNFPGSETENEYLYYFYVIDTAKGVNNARAYYALRETPTVHEVKNYAFTHSEDWSTFTIGNTQWTMDAAMDNSYCCENGDVQERLVCATHDISDNTVKDLIGTLTATES